MDTAMKRMMALIAVVLLLGLGGLGYQYFFSKPPIIEEDNGEVVSRIIWSRMQEAPSVRVSSLTGDMQGVAEIRATWLGSWFDVRQEARFPFDVDYFVDLKSIHLEDLHWNAERRELRIDLPDVSPNRPNIDEGRRSDVRTTGWYVTREAGEELSRKVSADATQRTGKFARSAKNMERAREHARYTFGKYFSMPLVAAGHGDVSVIVTFPIDRHSRDREDWDRTARIKDVVAEHGKAR